MALLSAALLSATLLSACSAGNADGPNSSAETGESDNVGTVLATVTLSATHSVTFSKLSTGRTVVFESGSEDDPPVEADVLRQGFVAAYRTWAKTDRAPQVLITADAERIAAQGRTATLDVPALERAQGQAVPDGGHRAPVSGADSSLLHAESINYTTDAAWFTRKFCSVDGVDGNWCPTNVGWANTGSVTTDYFDSTCLAASQTATAAFKVYYYDGSAWQNDYKITLQPRHYKRFIDTTNPIKRKATCTGADPDPHVDLSYLTRWAPAKLTALEDFPSNREADFTNDMDGVTHDDYGYWWFTGTVYGSKAHGRLWSRARDVDIGNEPHIYTQWRGTWNHFGDPVQTGGVLYVPLEPGDHGTGVGSIVGGVGAFDIASTPGTPIAITAMPLDAASPQATNHDPGLQFDDGTAHGPCPWIAYNRLDGLFYSSTYNATVINKYRLETSPDWHMVYVGNVPLKFPSGSKYWYLESVQGGKFATDDGMSSNRLYLTVDARPDDQMNGIVVVNPYTGEIEGNTEVDYDGSTSLGAREELEGLDIIDSDDPARAPDILNHGQIHVILVDNNNVEKDGWYFKHFRTGTIGRL
jgi:hypothetical protein